MSSNENQTATMPVLKILHSSDEAMRALLKEHGYSVDRFSAKVPTRNTTQEVELVPLPGGWLRLAMDESRALSGQLVSDPVEQRPVGLPFTVTDAEVPEVHGWLSQRSDATSDLAWWLRILRDPKRESWAAILYDSTDPEPRLVILGLYPDAVVYADPAPAIALVESHPAKPDMARARLVRISQEGSFEETHVIAEGPAGGVRLVPCALRRFLKVARGVRSRRIWQLFDIARPGAPEPIDTLQPLRNPQLADVGILDDDPVLLEAINDDEGCWRADATLIEGNRPGQCWTVAQGVGSVRQVVANDGCALLRVGASDEQHLGEKLLYLPVNPLQSVSPTQLADSPGSFRIVDNASAQSVGFVVHESRPGGGAMKWLFDSRGGVLIEPALPESETRSHRATCLSDDGYEVAVDVRWRGDKKFQGPVILHVYGAYGIDLDLDSDPQLPDWLDHGYAVATAAVRGGGDAQRHHDGSGLRRERSVADTLAAIEWLRSEEGPVVASQVCAIGASAGGFLVASLLVETPETIDAGVIVNGYVDPLLALTHLNSPTKLADQDEWGDPLGNPQARAVLERLSPRRRLNKPTADTLVVIAARDRRVDPRLGLAWVIRSRVNGGHTTLWYDLEGGHDLWGRGVDPSSLVNWVDEALGVGPFAGKACLVSTRTEAG